jgi:hypothetical protein
MVHVFNIEAVHLKTIFGILSQTQMFRYRDKGVYS